MQNNFNMYKNLVELMKLGHVDNALILNLLSKIKETDMSKHYMKAHGICHIFDQRLASLLHELAIKDFEPEPPLLYDIREFYVERISSVMQQWPKYSGDMKYPVPSTEDLLGPRHMYINSKNLWTGEYGDLRKELLDFLIERFKAQ